MFQKFPYSNEHELNLDWIIRQFKKLFGGATGQILAKKSNTDYDFTWRNIGPFETVNTIQDIANVQEDHCLVLHNNSDLGDGGPCWFEVLDYGIDLGYINAKGKYMYPMLGQAALLSVKAPERSLWGVIRSYVENTALVYGNDHGMFAPTVTNEIDCSTFVEAVLNGVPYGESRYIPGNTINRRTVKISGFGISHQGTIGYGKSYRLAQYCAEHKWMHPMPDAVNVGNTLQFGDLLFMDHHGPANTHTFQHIGHVAIVLSVFSVGGKVVVAQAGSSPGEMTEQNNTAGPGMISTLIMSDEYIKKYVPCFARIPYSSEDPDDSIPMYEAADDGFTIKPVFLPNTYVADELNGVLAPSRKSATTAGFIPVLPGMEIKSTGQITGPNGDYTITVAEYDKHLNYISSSSFRTSTVTLTNDTEFIRITAGYDDNYPFLISDMDAVLAVILSTLPAAPVQSVNGQTGDVNLSIPTTAAEVGALALDGSSTSFLNSATDDANNFTTGIFLCGPNVANIPNASYWMIISVGSSTTRMQIAYKLFNNGAPQTRNITGGSWGSWSNIAS